MKLPNMSLWINETVGHAHTESSHDLYGILYSNLNETEWPNKIIMQFTCEVIIAIDVSIMWFIKIEFFRLVGTVVVDCFCALSLKQPKKYFETSSPVRQALVGHYHFSRA